MSSTSSPVQYCRANKAVTLPQAKELSTMFSNYTLPKGLQVHPIHVSRTEEDGQVIQDRFWAIVAQVYDQSHVHARIDVNVLQPML